MNFKLLYVLIIISSVSIFSQTNNSWYISNNKGNDNNSGLSISSPKKTTSFLNTTTIKNLVIQYYLKKEIYGI